MEIGTIVASILTIAILSFLYRDNPLYRVAEYLLVGVSIGYALVLAWTSTLMDLLIEPLLNRGEWSLLVPLGLGLLMFGRFYRRTRMLARIPIAVLIGSGAGVAIPAMIDARILKQLSDSVTPIITANGTFDISGLVIIVGLVSTLAYFYFSHEHTGWLGRTAKLGTYFLMIFFGTTFGYTVMSRMSTFIGRVEFLLVDLLKLTH